MLSGIDLLQVYANYLPDSDLVWKTSMVKMDNLPPWAVDVLIFLYTFLTTILGILKIVIWLALFPAVKLNFRP